ncbi:MAG: potassium channel family protein [Gammaproteobacteria bacterium]
MIVFPIINEYASNYLFVIETFFPLLLVISVYVISANRQLLTIALLFALLTISVIGFNYFIHSPELLNFSLLLSIIFFGLTTVTLIIHVLSYKKVSADKIYGAICGYLLMGIVWALIYTLIEHKLPGSFHASHIIAASNSSLAHPRYLNQFIYFSFTTLTTLGYGDITPITSISRAFTSLEAVAGQLYIAVLIARLVGLHISHQALQSYGRLSEWREPDV